MFILHDAGEFQSEKDFSQAVVDLAKGCGWKVFMTWNSKHSPPGDLDLRMVRPPRYLVAELKVKKNKPTEDQAETLILLSQCPGVETYLWYPRDWDALEKVLER